ncbi:TatD family hydrolase [Frateuria hangzhouensis]|uniref:TatD family hydrolase n=1 Tax=Frateuria hangzhouensis TaxID=2995589 RepID=UPI0022609E87|nr:TatD family hydrolase [Frateuria sp. STR12]MCX7512225.1 TatD family hydrolase [Frateuria sp. STR12]
MIDSHVHIDDASFDVDRGQVLDDAAEAGVRQMVVPGIDAASWPRIAALCERHAALVPAYGLHPLFLAQHRPEHLELLRERLGQGTAVALGEIGLDFYVPELDRDQQQYYFETQLQLALEFDLPVIVHARRAVEEVALALRGMPGLRGVVHSFAGSEQQAERLYEMDFMLGIGGPITYPRAKRLRRLVATMPIEHLLLETDAPDQPNAGHQGARNEPARMLETLQAIAELRGESPEAIAAATTANARRLFGLRTPAPAP